MRIAVAVLLTVLLCGQMGLPGGVGVLKPVVSASCVAPLDAAADTPVIAISTGRQLKGSYASTLYTLFLSGGTTLAVGQTTGANGCQVADTSGIAAFCGSPLSNCHYKIVNDQSGNGCNPTQTTFANALPYNGTGLNSLPTADSGSSAAVMSCTLANGLTVGTMFLVGNQSNCGVNGTWVEVGDTNAVHGSSLRFSASHGWDGLAGDGTSQANPFQGNAGTHCNGITDEILTFSNSVQTGYADGGVWLDPTTTGLTMASQTSFKLGNRGSNDVPYTGTFAELIIVTTAGLTPASGSGKTFHDNMCSVTRGWNCP